MLLNCPRPMTHFLKNDYFKIISNSHYDPHSVLGLHTTEAGERVVRLWRPGAKEIHLEVFGNILTATRIEEAGIFEVVVPSHTTFYDYRVYTEDGILSYDPYSFLPTFSEVDQYLFSTGVHYELYKKMGGRLVSKDHIEGISFTVWAPNARSVSVIGDFNRWNGRLNPLRSLGGSGVWELFVPGLKEGEKYKFEIFTQDGRRLIKADPYNLASELRPLTASIVTDLSQFCWQDQEWIQFRSKNSVHTSPMNVYEVHLGSWKKRNGHFLNYRELAFELAAYCREMGFTHIELLPIQEHPLDESWGYQVSGYYAVTSRFGTPQDFQYFVNYLHQQQIGIILDWVPGHFPMDEFSLSRFDGTAIYEHEDSRQGYHPHWHTNIFNFGRKEVSNFLIANALFWLKEMHIDGLRVDAVASMLYLDYGRDDGAWIPNVYGGKENLEAIEFLKHLNSIVHQECPGSLMIAEESTSFPAVTRSVLDGGLGFDLKWNMGWMNDSLRYFSKDMIYRKHHHDDLTFGLLYAFSEKFQSVLSHDEVVHGKKSLIGRMPGDMWQQFANLRLLLSYMICQPGKKLLFMGGEIAQWKEWNAKEEIEWLLLNFQTHAGVQRMVKTLNHLYLEHPAFWEKEDRHDSFEWIDFADRSNSVISYFRVSSGERLLCVHNFTPQYFEHYTIHTHQINHAVEIFNSDEESFGGSGKHQKNIHHFRDSVGRNYGIQISLAPLATMIFKVN